MFKNKVFENAKSLSDSGSKNNHLILKHILFSTFFRVREGGLLCSLFRSVKQLVRSHFSCVFISESCSRGSSVIVANTKKATHYQLIEKNVTALLERNGVRVCTVEKTQNFQFSPAIAARSLFYLFWLIYRLKLQGVPVGALLPYAPSVIEHYQELILSMKHLRDQLSDKQAVVVINENWMPSSTLLYACSRLGIKTIHYPHGLVDSYNLPLISDVQLVWNEQMKKTFQSEGGHRLYAVGFLESYGGGNVSDSKVDLKYDVLITSQVHWKKFVTDGEPYVKIFDIWQKALEVRPNVRLIIKLHPFDTEENRITIKSQFDKYRDRCLVLGGSAPLPWLMQHCRIHATVDSGALLTAIRQGKPTFLHGDGEIMQRHGLRDAYTSVQTLKDLLRELDHLSEVQGFERQRKQWITDDAYIESQFRHFVAQELRDEGVFHS